MRIYLDMCSLQRPLDDRSQLRVRLEAEAVLAVLSHCRSGRSEIFSSDALEYEAVRNPHPVRRAHALDILGEADEFVVASPELETRARTWVEAGLKPLDALHLAGAVEAGADFFCTCDDRLLKRARSLNTGATRVLSPLELFGELGR